MSSEVRESCREWIYEDVNNRCGKAAVAILWGKLFDPEAQGPRCLEHAEKHLDGTLERRLNDQWAIFDLRNLRRIK